MSLAAQRVAVLRYVTRLLDFGKTGLDYPGLEDAGWTADTTMGQIADEIIRAVEEHGESPDNYSNASIPWSEYSPRTFLDTKNTIASYRPAGLTHKTLNNQQIGEFHAERMLEGGYIVVHAPEHAKAILAGRKSS